MQERRIAFCKNFQNLLPSRMHHFENCNTGFSFRIFIQGKFAVPFICPNFKILKGKTMRSQSFYKTLFFASKVLRCNENTALNTTNTLFRLRRDSPNAYTAHLRPASFVRRTSCNTFFTTPSRYRASSHNRAHLPTIRSCR